MQPATKCGSVAKPEYKVKFAFKLLNFICAVIALSWFFEGWRQVTTRPTVEHVLLLAGGTLLTLFFLGIHSYWAYVEEKCKGTLRKRIALFEKIYSATFAKRNGDK